MKEYGVQAIVSLMRSRKRRLGALAWVALVLAAFACGSRTGLLVPEEGPIDGGPDVVDASHRDAVPDTLPPIDVTPPIDVNRNDCPDADATLVYVVTQANELLSFYPPSAQFKRIGTIACPATTPGAQPFSMAVDRKGIARVLFDDGELFRVSTATAACQSTPFQPNQFGFTTFGMGYASDTNGPNEQLYIARDQLPAQLASIDTTYALHPIALFNPPIQAPELTGTGAGGLFAFYAKQAQPAPDSFIGQIDKTNGRVIGETPLLGLTQGNGWAFAFWGGDFYLFTGTGTSIVTRYRPSDNSRTLVATSTSLIVGAGVSTCAPQN